MRMLGKTVRDVTYEEWKDGIGGNSSSVSAKATVSPARPSARAITSDWRELASRIVQSTAAFARADPRILLAHAAIESTARYPHFGMVRPGPIEMAPSRVEP
jgi:hypothetical protein